MMKQNPTTSKVCFNAAHAFAPTIGIASCNLVAITAKMPAQLQTSQKNDTVQPARTLRCNGNFDRWTESKMWLVNWEPPTWEAANLIRSNPKHVKMAEEYEISTVSHL
jgi:hypothetical protein